MSHRNNVTVNVTGCETVQPLDSLLALQSSSVAIHQAIGYNNCK